MSLDDLPARAPPPGAESGTIVRRVDRPASQRDKVTRAEELKISVTTNDGKTYEARYIAGEPESDLAILKIDGPKPAAWKRVPREP